MDFESYQEGTTKTFKPHSELSASDAGRVDWTVGMMGEVGEVAELVKHSIFHKEEMDKMKLAKEVGDVLWYVAALCKSYDIPMEACAKLNLAKLQHRHGSSFSFEKSADRHAREDKFEDTAIYKTLKRTITGIYEPPCEHDWVYDSIVEMRSSDMHCSKCRIEKV